MVELRWREQEAPAWTPQQRIRAPRRGARAGQIGAAAAGRGRSPPAPASRIRLATRGGGRGTIFVRPVIHGAGPVHPAAARHLTSA